MVAFLLCDLREKEDSMNLTTVSKMPKGQMKCNLCRSSCATKNGDWFFAPKTPSQQIFLCRSCELSAKGKYTKVNPTARAWS